MKKATFFVADRYNRFVLVNVPMTLFRDNGHFTFRLRSFVISSGRAFPCLCMSLLDHNSFLTERDA